jgi:hypothetical protein
MDGKGSMQLPAQPQTRVDATAEFFIWIRRNPLKRAESAKGIQGNPSLFPWIPLVFFGFLWIYLAETCPQVALPPPDEGHLGRHDGHGEHIGRER